MDVCDFSNVYRVSFNDTDNDGNVAFNEVELTAYSTPLDKKIKVCREEEVKEFLRKSLGLDYSVAGKTYSVADFRARLALVYNDQPNLSEAFEAVASCKRFNSTTDAAFEVIQRAVASLGISQVFMSEASQIKSFEELFKAGYEQCMNVASAPATYGQDVRGKAEQSANFFRLGLLNLSIFKLF